MPIAMTPEEKRHEQICAALSAAAMEKAAEMIAKYPERKAVYLERLARYEPCLAKPSGAA